MQPLAKILPLIIKTITGNYPEILAIYAFGSFVTAKTTPTSDLDLAILLPDKADAYKIWNLGQEIAIMINRDVDLIDLRTTSTIFGLQIIATGKRIYCADQNKVAAFENIIFSEYINFQERRAKLLTSIKERGGIMYG